MAREYLPDSLLLWKETLSLLIPWDDENMIEIDSLLSLPSAYIRIGEIIT